MSDAVVAGPDGWLFTPECAAVHPFERTAIIADVHLGYEWTRGDGGDCLPAHSLRETLARLASLLDRVAVTRLVVAGDLVESARPCLRTARDLAALKKWLAERGVELVALAGNHDPVRRPPLPETLELAGWTIGHGHLPLKAPRTVCGHHHPHLRAQGVSAPCFLVGRTSIVLPAFSLNAAGVSLAALPSSLLAGRRCLALAGGILLDFGPAQALIRRLRTA